MSTDLDQFNQLQTEFAEKVNLLDTLYKVDSGLQTRIKEVKTSIKDLKAQLKKSMKSLNRGA